VVGGKIPPRDWQNLAPEWFSRQFQVCGIIPVALAGTNERTGARLHAGFNYNQKAPDESAFWFDRKKCTAVRGWKTFTEG
jgi:hypothetical protein